MSVIVTTLVVLLCLQFTGTHVRAQQQDVFLGATRRGALSTAPMPLSLDDAIGRGLNYNIGLLVSGSITDQARAARLEQLSEMLPQINGSVRESRQKTNLQALGIGFSGVPPTVEVSNFDVRASVTAPLIDLHALAATRAAAQRVSAAEWDYRNARETVALAIASAYLQTVSAEAALGSAQADLQTAQSLYQLAGDRERNGLAPNIDTLRARVELQVRQQAVTQAQNTLDKQRIALLRIVGLPFEQPVVITTRAAYRAIPEPVIADSVTRATAMRQDYKAAEAQVRAAEDARRAAELERAPTVAFNGDYGALGTAPSNALSTWSAAGVLRIPIFNGGRIQAHVAQAGAALDQQRAELEDLRISIEQQVTNAVLDVRAAAQQVDVAAATIDYARQALMQAQDRFSAGVANTIEVVQAQESLANANSEYITALHAHNIAKLLLMRAMGSTEQSWKDVLAP